MNKTETFGLVNQWNFKSRLKYAPFHIFKTMCCFSILYVTIYCYFGWMNSIADPAQLSLYVLPSMCPKSHFCFAISKTFVTSAEWWISTLSHDKHPNCTNKCTAIRNTTDAHAVIFYGRGLTENLLKKLQSHRPDNQIWIYYDGESPASTMKCYGIQCIFKHFLMFTSAYQHVLLREGNETTKLAQLFNWTATYRSDSTIFTPYGYVKPLTQTINKESFDKSLDRMIAKKQHFAFIMVSNCHPYNSRAKMLSDLSQFIDLHIYGKCGNGTSSVDPIELTKKYWFHLSFENSFCKDYITEKFFLSGLQGEAIPVVFGGYSRKDYEAVAPNSSFIYAGDYSDMKQLASYMKYVVSNMTLYKKYFSWKQHFKSVASSNDPSDDIKCQICGRLIAEYGKVTRQIDINKFFQFETQCHKPDFALFH